MSRRSANNVPRVIAAVDLRRIQSNLTLLAGAVRGSYGSWKGAVPMVKCNAYGHGMVETARALARHRETLAFGVATLDEGIALRSAGIRKPIWVFSDCTPWTESVAGAVFRHELTPVLHSAEDLRAVLHPRHAKRWKSSGFHLKFNTGMNRLGLPLKDLPRVRSRLIAAGVRLEGVCTHLASSEDSEAPVTREQIGRFREVVGELSSLDISYIHSANTAAMLGERRLGLGQICNVARPGIGLYGYAGTLGARLGLRPALTWKARVIAARFLEKGMQVGYGATFRAERATAQSILGVGYGDGFRRGLSGREILLRVPAGFRSARILGRVSMDLTSVGLRSKPGSWVTLLGEGEEQGRRLASSAGTIVYEILTSISARVPRVYS